MKRDMNTFKRFIKRLLVCVVIATCMQACIENNIPYPRIQANILAISAKGESKPALIDSLNRKVTLYFPEEANIYAVTIDSFLLSNDTHIVSGSLSPNNPIDLSSKYFVTLHMYQDYVWEITSSQEIERNFVIDGQIGTSTIDVPGRRVVATVSNKTPLGSIYVVSCKLGPTTSTMTPDINGKYVDFSHPVTINVENYGHFEQWNIYIEQTESTVTTVRADAWTQVAWVYAEALAERKNTIQYRIKGDTEWLTVPDEWLTFNGGAYHARLIGLTPMTTYETRAVSDTEYGEVLEFTTGFKAQVPNSNFDEWWLNGKVWNPWPEGGEQIWDTGNVGATTLGRSNSVPTDDTVTGSGQAAKLESKFVGIGALGKLAAGNIFVGKYMKTDGTNGILNFGKPFTQRPTKLKGYYKYTTAPISATSAGYNDLKGRPDTCQIYIALIDLKEPLEIRTNPNNRQLFDPKADYVIAYGSIQSGSDVPAYTPFEIELDYRATNRVPTYIIITCSASKYGDFFTGGNGAVLYIDDFELKYDY